MEKNHLKVLFWSIPYTNSKELKSQAPTELELFSVSRPNKNYEFWQSDLLAIPLFTRKVAYQKLDYIHNNPLAGKWQLAESACDYRYSSAKFYEKGIKEFDFLKDLREEF